jgi:hypothetical protein
MMMSEDNTKIKGMMMGGQKKNKRHKEGSCNLVGIFP